MGSRLGGKSTVSTEMTFVPNDRHAIGDSPSILPDIAFQDLRHPNPIRPVFSIRQVAFARSYSHRLWHGLNDRADCRVFGRNNIGWRPYTINRTLLEDRPDG